MSWYNDLIAYFNELGRAVNVTIDKGNQIVDSLQALKMQIDSLSAFLSAIHQYSVILLIMLGVQFVVILVLWAGQSSIKRKLDNIEARMIAPKGDK